MVTELKTYDVAERLTDETEISLYLEAAFEDGDSTLIKAALADVARARGMTEIARQANMSRAGLYRALGDDGNPTLENLSGILGAFGMKLSVKPIAVAAS